MKKTAVWPAVLLCILAFGAVFGAGHLPGGGTDPGIETSVASCTEPVLIHDHYFELELALTDSGRQRGLMYREEILFDRGMLFVFTAPSIRAFWMANCLTDIDIIFLDARGAVTATHHMRREPPRSGGETEEQYYDRLPRYSSTSPAQFAIELKAGTLELLNLHIGEQILLDIERLRTMATSAAEDE